MGFRRGLLSISLLAASFAWGDIPSADQTWIARLFAKDESVRVEAATMLARRHRDGKLDPHADARLREIFMDKKTSRRTRIAIGLYFGELIHESEHAEL